jgi:hypothetical protein
MYSSITNNTATLSELEQFQLTHDSDKKQKNLDKYQMLCIQFELLMMGGETA